jgi:hypothetical protein
LAVVEPDQKLRLEINPAPEPLDNANDIAVPPLRRHAIDQPDRTRLRFENRFQNQRFAPIGVADTGRGIGGADLPAPVFLRAQESGKTGVGIEARRAEPVDGTVNPDKGAGMSVADKSVILDSHFEHKKGGGNLRRPGWLLDSS